MKVQEFFDPSTFTLSYVVYDENTRDGIVIDPLYDYDPAASKLSRTSISRLISWIREAGIKVHFSLETHAHADHISGSQILKNTFSGCRVAITEKIRDVQKVFRDIYGMPKEFAIDGSQFDMLLQDDHEFTAGSLRVRTMFTPGHTPACASFLIGNSVFTGDALFMPDYGTGRCDFPAGCAEQLYDSIHERLYRLPDETLSFTCHDYQPGGRPLKFCATISEQKRSNIQLQQTTSKADFVRFRTERDKTLSTPKLLWPSVQINIDGGHIPKPDSHGRRFLKIPLSE